jgi:starch phosphorylase
MSTDQVLQCKEALAQLAGNLWWSWQPQGDTLWAKLDREQWTASHHSPGKLLSTLGDGIDELLSADDSLRGEVISWRDRMNQALNTDELWHDQEGRPCEGGVVYFCSEYGLHESVATYSGGLGILAGDHVKSASDLGLPFVGVGLLYRRGYVQQRLSADGEQHSEYLTFDFDSYPAKRARNAQGELIKVTAPLLDGEVAHCQVWELSVGRVSLYLLDADLEENSDEVRALTANLYGGDHLTRIRQELILGVGGVRALRALDMSPRVYHLNEGHSSFLNLERLRELCSSGESYESAVAKIRASSVFTTHTPVEAGHDRFDVETAWRGLKWFADEMGLSREQVLALGHWPDERDPNALFNMTLLAMHTCAHLNGVAALHGEVSRQMFGRFWGDIPTDEVPIGSVTNGVHAPTWQAEPIRALVQDQIGGQGAECWEEDTAWGSFSATSDAQLWRARRACRQSLIDLGRSREATRRARLGLPAWEDRLDPDALTIGFARRFATYKRANLIFSEMERLIQILESAPGPVQLFFAGKAHPADEGGKALVRAVYEASEHPALRGRVLLIEDYDIEVGRAMVQGADVWLNNPRRPKEASGTSGMKVAMNGGLNLSILDGWWPEGYNGENGWTIGQERDYNDPNVQDRDDALSLYERLEHDVIPLFFKHDDSGRPTEWLKMAKAAIASCTPQFHSNRQVRDYVRNLYSAAR